jgi:hypothetical protein
MARGLADHARHARDTSLGTSHPSDAHYTELSLWKAGLAALRRSSLAIRSRQAGS